MLVMHVPNRAAFIQTLHHEHSPALHAHREAGLLCQELITIRPGD